MTAETIEIPLQMEECVRFPYALARIAAGPFDALAALDQPRSLEALAAIRSTRAQLDAAAALLRDETFTAIGGCDDATLRRLLLRAKRDLFNGRALDARTLEELQTHADGHLPHLADYAAAVRHTRDAEAAFVQAFDAELSASRDALRTLAASEKLHAPLALSSAVLLEQVRRYATRPAGRLTTKDRDVEQALMKYLTRMHAKTSPFSTFCHIGSAEFKPLDNELMSADDAGEPRSHVRLNHYVWLALRQWLISTPAVVEHFRIRVNPTLRRDGGQLCFLLNVRNVESIQRIDAPDALDAIIALANDSPPYRVLVDRVIATELVADDRPAAAHFIDGLIDNGLLEIEVPVSGTDPDWDKAAIALLAPISGDCPEAAKAIEIIEEFRTNAKVFSTAAADERTRLLAEAGRRFSTLRELSGRNAVDAVPYEIGAPVTVSSFTIDVNLSQERLFFEDSSLTGRITLGDSQLDAIVESLQRISNDLVFADPMRTNHHQARFYFEERYGRDATVPLLRFYEDFFRECRIVEHDARQGDAKEKVTAIYPGAQKFRDLLTTLAADIDRWVDALSTRLVPDTTGRIYIDCDDVEFAFSRAPGLREEAPDANSAFIQLTRDENHRVIAVLNTAAPGNGKTISRFMHLLPDVVLEEQRRVNRRLERRSRLAELRDASLHNANLHPPLVDAEIASPGGQTALPPEQLIPVSELVVRIGSDEALWLQRRTTGDRIEVLDLGLQALTGRSQLLQLLYTLFTRSRHISRLPLQRAANAAWQREGRPPDGGVVIRPRVIYDRRIVICRKSWTLPKAVLPVRAAEESDAAYFRRVDDWRLNLGIPAYVYASIALERTKLRARDDYKPQFVSFASWLSVAVLEKLIGRVDVTLEITEMLPSPESMLRWNGGLHQTEIIVQWHRRKS